MKRPHVRSRPDSPLNACAAVAAALLLLAGVSVHASTEPAAMIGPSASPAEARDLIAADAPAKQNEWTEKIRRSREPTKIEGDPFTSKSWTPPPKASPPPVPTVPPFPFTFLGKLGQQGAEPKVFLMRGEQLYTVRRGDVLDGAYRVDAIGENGIDVTYLPLDKHQDVAYADITPRPGPGSYAQSGGPVYSSPQRFAAADSPAVAAPGNTEVGTPGTPGGSVAVARTAQSASVGVAAGPASTDSGTTSASVPATDVPVPNPAAPGGTMVMLPPPSGTLPTQPRPSGTLPMEPPPSGFLPTLPPPSGTLPTLPPPAVK